MRWSVVTARDLQEAVQHARARPGTVLVDLDGTLGPTGFPLNASRSALLAVLGPILANGHGVLVVTNRGGAEQLDSRLPVVARARKPFTRLWRLPGDISCVIGDQLFADGLLAARLGVPIIHVPSLDMQRRRPLARWGDKALKPLFRNDGRER